MSRRRRRRYPSDLSDAEWALLEPLLAPSERRGRPPKWPAKPVADAVFYLLGSGRGACGNVANIRAKGGSKNVYKTH